MPTDFLQYEPEDEGFDRIRLDTEWRALNAVRELLRLSSHGDEHITYESSLDLARELLPRLFDPEKSLIAKGLEAPAIREYRQMAEAESKLENKNITPSELVDRDIREAQRLLRAGGRTGDIKRRLKRLDFYRDFFTQKKYSEHQLIRRDVFQAVRPQLPNPTTKDNYKEYQLANDRVLRIRMLHPDIPEHATGADLIYEVCSPNDSKARFVFIQYKIWDGNRLYFSKSRNLDDQLAKLSDTLCEKGFCAPGSGAEGQKEYRFPHCSGFLRLTDKLQSPDSRLVSTGFHIPVCVVRQWSNPDPTETRVIRKKDILGASVSTDVFEELFHSEMLGSRWIGIHDVEAFYKQHGILTDKERITIYAQEY